MSKGIYCGVQNKARRVKAVYYGVQNKAHRVKRVYVGVENVARLVYDADEAAAQSAREGAPEAE